METLLAKIRKNKCLCACHIVIDLALFVFLVSHVFDVVDDGRGVAQLVKYSIASGLSLVHLFVNSIMSRKEMTAEKEEKFCLIFSGLRIFGLVMMHLLWPISELEDVVYLSLYVVYVTEFMFFFCFTSFDNVAKRLSCYGVFAGGFGVMILTQYISRLYELTAKSTEFLRGIMMALIFMGAIVLIGEIFAGSWTHFEKKLFGQKRAMEDLDNANRELQVQQEKIKEINERLGGQKIELQAANKKINRSHDEMSVQNEIFSYIAKMMKKEELLEQITSVLHIRLDLDLAMVIMEEDDSIQVPNQEAKGRFVAIATNFGNETEERIKKAVQKSNLKPILSLTKTYIENAHTESVHLLGEFELEMASLICLPVVKQEERLATLILGRKRENGFMDGKAFYETIASQLSVAISNIRLYEKMNDMAIRDGLTRVYNRRYLTEQLNQYLRKAMTKRRPVSLALFDIDKFKMVNDTYGHQCGDEVIRHVARILDKGAMNHGGIVGRYGGEEFVIAFLDKTLEETEKVIEEIHQQIKSEPVRYDDYEVKVTTSAGIASYPKTCSNPSELLTRADWAMYHSKRNGRDQITIDSDKITDKM